MSSISDQKAADVSVLLVARSLLGVYLALSMIRSAIFTCPYPV